MGRLILLSILFFFCTSPFRAGAQTSSRLIQKTSYLADSLGNLSEAQDTNYVYSHGRGSDMKSHDYHYDTAWVRSQGNQWTHRERKTYLPDGRVKEWILQYLDPSQQWKNYRRTLYYYRGVNTLDSLVEQQWNEFNKSWWNYSALRYQFNAQGNLVEERKDAWYLNAYQPERRTQYHYAAGRLNQKEESIFHSGSSQWTPSGKTDYQYSGQALYREERFQWDSLNQSYIPLWAIDYRWTAGQKEDSTMEWQWDAQASQWAPRFLHCFAYDSQQQRLADTLFQFTQPLAQWGLSHLVLYQYDTAGNPVEKSEWMHLGGTWAPRFQWTWTYNAYNQPLIEDWNRWDAARQQWEPVTQGTARTEYRYELYNPSGISTPISAHPFRLYPNPVHQQLTLEIAEPTTNRIRARLMDMQGKAVLQWSWSAQGRFRERLDLDTIPPGNYIFQLEMGKEKYHQKITLSP